MKVSFLSEIHKKKLNLGMDSDRRSLTELLAELSQRRQVLVENEGMSPEKIRQILEARACELRAVGPQEDAEELLEIIEFTLGKEHYAFPLQWVSEVCRIGEVTEIPGTPAFVKGIVNLRSRIYSVVDLVKLLALPGNLDGDSGLDDRLLLVLVSQEMEFAVCIDHLEGVRLVPLKLFQTSIPTLSGVQAEYLKGVTADHLILLDAEKLLTDKKIVVEL